MASLPSPRAERRALVRRILSLWLIYLKGQLLAGVAVGAIIWLVLTALGVPYAPWLGVLAGVMELLPQIGWLISLAPAAILALWQGSATLPIENWMLALIVIGVYALIQLLQNLVIQPRIVGRGLSLPWYVVLIVILVGGLIGGILIPVVGSAIGAIVAVPILVAAREILRYSRRKRQGLPPLPPESPGA